MKFNEKLSPAELQKETEMLAELQYICGSRIDNSRLTANVNLESYYSKIESNDSCLHCANCFEETSQEFKNNT